MDDFSTKTQFSIRDIFVVIFKRKRTFFSIMILTTLLVTIGTYVVPLPYKAMGKLYVERAKSSTVPALLQPAGQFLGREDVLISEIEIITSRTVIERVTDKLQLHVKKKKSNAIDSFIKLLQSPIYALGLLDETDPREGSIATLQKKVKVKAVPKSDIIMISYMGDDPILIKEVINTMIETYLDRRLELFKSMRAEDFYAEQALLFKKKIDVLNKEKRDLQAKWSVGKINEDREALLRLMTSLKTELIIVEQKLASTEATIRELKETSRFVTFNDSKSKNLMLEKMGSDLVELVTKKNKLEQELKANNPTIKKLKVAIKQLRNNIMTTLSATAGDLELRREKLVSRLEDLYERKQNLNEGEVRLSEITSAIPFAEKSYLRYLKLQEAARLEEIGQADMVNVKVVDYAVVPSQPIFPKLVFIFIGVFVGFIAAYGFVLLLEFIDNKIDSVDDITHFTEMQVFAVLPEVKK